MKFEEVIQFFREGGTIHRTIWTHGVSKEWKGNIFEAEDILADDWEVVE